jgi:hypothetical protein
VIAIGQLATGVFAVGQAAFGVFAAGMGTIGVLFQAGFDFGGTSAHGPLLGLSGRLHVDPHARGPILETGGLPGWRIVLATLGTLVLAAAW